MADLIDRQELISWLSNDPLFPQVESFGLTSVIESRPSVDAEPVRHGHWIRDFSITEDTFYKCSVCGRQECLLDKYDPKEEMPYCHCGAKMDEVREDV